MESRDGQDDMDPLPRRRLDGLLQERREACRVPVRLALAQRFTSCDVQHGEKVRGCRAAHSCGCASRWPGKPPAALAAPRRPPAASDGRPTSASTGATNRIPPTGTSSSKSPGPAPAATPGHAAHRSASPGRPARPRSAQRAWRRSTASGATPASPAMSLRRRPSPDHNTICARSAASAGTSRDLTNSRGSAICSEVRVRTRLNDHRSLGSMNSITRH